jgi:hypothetical protein
MTRALAALLECVGRRPGLPTPNSVEGFSDLDWRELIELAQRHRLTALLYHRLQSHGLAAGMPKEASAILRTEARSAALRGLRMQAEVLALGQAFHDAAIPVIVLKGGDLANRVYEGIGLRWMGDLDLLVDRPDTERALAVLAGRGYRSGGESSLDVALVAHHHAAPLRNDGCCVEMHWSLVPPYEPFGVDPATLWSRSVPAGAAVPGLRALAVTDLLVHLCVHAACNHNLEMGLQPLVDITELCHSHDLNWAALQDASVEWNAARPVSLMLQLARELLGARTPAPGDCGWRLDVCNPELVALAKENLMAQTIGPLPANILQLGRVQGVWQRLASAVMATVAPARVAHIYGLELNSWSTPVYQARRAIDVLWRHGPNLLRLGMNEGRLRESSEKRARLIEWLRVGDDLS